MTCNNCSKKITKYSKSGLCLSCCKTGKKVNFSIATRKDISERAKKRNVGGEQSLNWKGGISKDKRIYNRNLYKRLSGIEKSKRVWSKNKRNRMKRANGGSHSFAEWELLKTQYNWTCPCCKKIEPKIKLVQDHIIAVSKGGSDNIENIQPLCRSCNAKKMIKIIKY